MMWNPTITRDALRAAGMTVPCDFTVGGLPFPGIHVKWFQPDKLYLDDASQQTNYHIEFWTEDLPGIGVGDTLVTDGQQYELINMPGFSEGKSGGHYSTVRLKATDRTYPKRPILFPGGTIPSPPSSPSPAPGVGLLSTWLVTVDGAQSITVSSTVTAVPFITINGLIQPQGSYSFAAPVITYPGTLNILSGDTVGAFLVV
jgi:hypothetical protein